MAETGIGSGLARASARGVAGTLLLLLGVLAAAPAGCGSDDEKDLFTKPFDAGVDVANDAPDGAETDPTLGGPCTEDAQCDDAVPCTYDKCDQTLSRCRNTPDDTQCADNVHCNGREVCVLRRGCAAGPVVTCQDDDLCTIDRCIEASKTCVHEMRDVDGDGDPDDHCVGKRDCDDTDPTVSSQRAEICGNGKDDNCNGVVDEQPCAEPANDTCASALLVTAPNTYLLSTVAAKKDYATSCTVKSPAAARDVVVAIKVPGIAGDPAKNVSVWATAGLASNEVAVALETTCGVSASETSCGHVAATSHARAIARNVAAGATVYAIVTTQAEGAVDLKVAFADASGAPTNETCSAPEAIALETPFTVSLVDAAKDLASDCTKAKTGELTYAFTLNDTRDVRIFANTLAGAGEPMVTLRDAGCTNELRCRVGTNPPVFARSLPPGTYTFGVAGTAQIDVNVLVKTYPPTAAPANQSCATAPPVVANTAMTVDLSAQEDAIKNGCLAGAPAAAYALELTQASDVLVIGRFPPNVQGGVAINGAACTTADMLACATGTTPARVSKRNLPAGSYRVVIADERGSASARLDVLVRPTVSPTAVSGSDGCVGTLAIPAAGGFFTGDTTNMTADFDAGCDSPGAPFGGAKDQLLRLDLAQPRRVVLDMSGSFYSTLLDVRKGNTCPGIEVPDACYVGFGANKSFLDLALGAGTHWIQVDGYNADKGAWNLDVRVLPP